MNRTSNNAIGSSIEALGDICDFAYKRGYHELGYNPVDTVCEMRDELDRLRLALRGLHDDNADYLRINKLGGYDNHWMKAAREALGLQPPDILREYFTEPVRS